MSSYIGYDRRKLIPYVSIFRGFKSQKFSVSVGNYFKYYIYSVGMQNRSDLHSFYEAFRRESLRFVKAYSKNVSALVLQINCAF